MNKLKGIFLQLLMCLFFAVSLFACMNKEVKREAVENNDEKSATQFDPRNYRFPREEGMTKGGYPFALSGKPYYKTSIIKSNYFVKYTIYTYLTLFNPTNC
jgi:hypothetical protein